MELQASRFLQKQMAAVFCLQCAGLSVSFLMFEIDREVEIAPGWITNIAIEIREFSDGKLEQP